ncbi:MAG: PKD domain-containing protein [Methanosarcina sp.]
MDGTTGNGIDSKTMTKIFEIGQRVSILDQSVSSTRDESGNEVLTFVYSINNPSTENIENVRLGAQIRTNDPQGEWIDDPSNDQIITLLPGTNDYSRTFIVPQSASLGFYDARWVILDDTTGNWIDSKTMTRVFEEVARPRILDQSISPTLIESENGRLTFTYNINNPSTENIENVRLGAQIRTNDPQGEWIDDPSNDQIITLLPGTNDYLRTFTVPQSASSGSYDARWVILDDATGNWIDSKTTTGIFEVITRASSSGGPDYLGYTFKDSNAVGGPTYDWIEISETGTIILPSSDDFYIDGIPVGFFFNYYGTDYSQVSITNNGITLASGGTSQWYNQPIGNSGPHNFIAPFWDDLVTWGSAGAVYYQVIGEAPNRKFVVEWFDNQGFSSTPSGITFEAILYEGTNDIKFQYKDVDFGSGYYNNGASATVGIEGADGRGLQYSYDEPVINPNMAILFKFPAFSGTNMYISKNAPVSKDHGSLMTYTLYYNNFGSTEASNVVVQDTLPSNVEFDAASDGGTYDPATRKVTWDVGSVAPLARGSRTVSVRILDSVPVGTVVQNTASISTTTLETRYDDNSASASTTVTGSSLPPDVGVEPNNGGSGTTSVYWQNSITYSYDSCDTATGVDINIHINDGGPDITGSMTGGPSHWTYTAAPFYPRHGEATITYTVHGCTQSTVSFNIYIDPAGYIYDVDTEERIAGASVWLQRPDGTGEWENVPTGENPPVAQPDENPLVTDQYGMYQWDTLAGSYRVHVVATGYMPADSIMVNVYAGHPVTDLHVGLQHINVPPVADAGGPYEGTAGVALRFNGSESYDPDANWRDSIISYDWDLNGDGVYGDATGATIDHTWDQAYSGQISLQVTDTHVATNTSSTSINIREVEQDLIPPTIPSAVLFPANTTAGSKINITVDATDNSGVSEVKAGNVPLVKDNDGFWKGNITAPSSRGDYSLLIKANDTVGNAAETTVPYHVVQLSGGASIAASPKTSSVIAGSNVSLAIKVKNVENIDDTFKVWISVSELPLSSQANLTWFDWTEQNVKLRAGEEVLIPIKVDVPAGIVTGRKLFRANVKSGTSGISGLNTGYLVIS